MIPSTFFELRIQVVSRHINFFQKGSLRCGPYLSHVEAARVMMDGIHIALFAYLNEINQLEEPIAHSQIVECMLLDGKVETIGIKSEEVRSL